MANSGKPGSPKVATGVVPKAASTCDRPKVTSTSVSLRSVITSTYTPDALSPSDRAEG